jgi:hypothetical protein
MKLTTASTDAVVAIYYDEAGNQIAAEDLYFVSDRQVVLCANELPAGGGNPCQTGYHLVDINGTRLCVHN